MRSKAHQLRPAALGGGIVLSAAVVLLAGTLAAVLLSGGAAYSQAEPAVSGAVGAPPVAANDTLSAVSGVPVDLDVLANDYDPDGAQLEISGILTGPESGSAAIYMNNTMIKYTSNAGYAGPDSLEYEIRDAEGNTGTAHVMITVGRAGPSVAISSPADGSELSIFDEVSLEASATGAGGGDISANMQWSSDILGDLGTGNGARAKLTYGTHNITARAAGPDGSPASHSVIAHVSSERPGYAGTGIASASAEAGRLVSLGAADPNGIPDSSGLPAGFPDGQFAWRMEGLEPGSTARLSFEALEGYSEHSRYWAAANGTWLDASAALRHDGGKFALSVQDGGPYDADGVADGAVRSAGGLGILKEVPVYNPDLFYGSLRFSSFAPPDSSSIRYAQHGLTLTGSGNFAGVSGGYGTPFGVSGGASSKIEPGEWVLLSFDFPIERMRLGLNAVPPAAPDRLSQAGQYRFLVTSYDANGALIENKTVFYSVPYDPVQVSPGVSQFSHVRVEPIDALASLSDLSYDGFMPSREAAFAAPHGARAPAGHSGLIAFGDGGPTLDVAALDARLSGAAGASGGSADAAVARDPAGGTVLVGAPTHGTGGSAFAFDAKTGELLAELENPAPRDGDRFGFAVATDGSTHVVGAPGYDDPSGAGNSGATYIFDENGTHAVPNPDPRSGDMFGSAVSITNKEIAVHCPQCAEGGAPYSLDRSDLGASLDAHAELRYKSASSGAAGAAGPTYVIYYPFEKPDAGEPVTLPWDLAAQPSGGPPESGAGFVSASAGAGGLAAASLAGALADANGSRIEFQGGFFEWGIAGLGKGEGTKLDAVLPDVPHENSTYWALANGAWANASHIVQPKNISFSLDMLDGGPHDSDPADGRVSVTGGFGILLPNMPPAISIASPANGSEFSIFDDVLLEAAASDPDGEDVNGSVAWRSDILGYLGGGARAEARLSYGTHTITAYAQDAAGEEASHSVVVTVSPKRPTHSGTGIASAFTDSGRITSISAANKTLLPDATDIQAGFPDDFFSWEVEGLEPGSRVTMSFTMLDGYSPHSRYWTAINGTWLDASAVFWHSGGNFLLAISDGGPYDGDGSADGKISNTGGIGIARQTDVDPSVGVTRGSLSLYGYIPPNSESLSYPSHGITITGSSAVKRTVSPFVGVSGGNDPRVEPGEWIAFSFDRPVSFAGILLSSRSVHAPDLGYAAPYNFRVTTYDINGELNNNYTKYVTWPGNYLTVVYGKEISHVRIEPIDSFLSTYGVRYDTSVLAPTYYSLNSALLSRFAFDYNDTRNSAGPDFDTVVHGATFADSPLSNRAISFDGQDDMLDILYGDMPGFDRGSFTISAWVSSHDPRSAPESLDSRQLIIANAQVGTGSYPYPRTDGLAISAKPSYSPPYSGHAYTYARSSNGFTDWCACPAFADGNMHHVGIVVDQYRRLAQLWYDGSIVHSKSYFAGHVASDDSVGLNIGGQISGNYTKYPFWGKVDEVMLYDRPLSYHEMRAISSPDYYKPGSEGSASGSFGHQVHSGLLDVTSDPPLLDVVGLNALAEGGLVGASNEHGSKSPARNVIGNMVFADGYDLGGTVLVGLPQYDAENATVHDPYVSDIGIALAFDGQTGKAVNVLENPQPEAADWFGYAVATDGTTHVVGAPGHDDVYALAGDSGMAYIFQGNETYAVPNPDPEHGDMFGSAVSITDDHITIYCLQCGAEGEENESYSLDRSDLQASLSKHIEAYHNSTAPDMADSEGTGAVGTAQSMPQPGNPITLPWDMAGGSGQAAASAAAGPWQSGAGFTRVSADSGGISSASLVGNPSGANGPVIEFAGGAFEWGVSGLDKGANATLSAVLSASPPEGSAYWALKGESWTSASSAARLANNSFSLDMLDGGPHDMDGRADGQVSITGGFGVLRPVSITSPANGSELSVFDDVLFEAATYGPDGRPTEDSVAWRSDILGYLGSGKRIEASLSYGAHNITAYARDAAGSVSTHSVEIYVSPARPAYAGTGITSASVSSGKIASILPANGTDLPDISGLPAGFPDGFFSWKVVGLEPGSYAELNFTVLDGYPAYPRYWAAVNGSWLDASAVLRHDGARLLLPVLDGGPYDADGATDGAVTVTGGLGFAERAAPDPSASISYQFLDLAGAAPSESGTFRSGEHGATIVASGALVGVSGHGGSQIGLGVLGQGSPRIGPGEWLSLSFDYPIDGLRVGVYQEPAPGKGTNGAYSFVITSYDANRALIENKTVSSPWHSYQLDTGVRQASFIRIEPLDSLVAASYLEYQSHVPPAEPRSIHEGLVARFSFDEGDLRNSAGADFGYNVSGAEFVNSSLAGLAASFDGIDDVISVLYDDRLGFGTGSYTVSTWASLPSAASAGPGFSPPPLQVMLTDTETRPPYLIASDGWLLGREMHYENSIKYHMSGGSDSRGSCLDPGPCRGHADGSYHRIGIVVDRHNSRAQAWYDGSLFYSHEGVAASPASPETSVGLHIGGQPDGDGVLHPMWGEIDEVLIYDRALSPSEMGSLYDSHRAQAFGSSGADPYSGMVHFGDGYPSLDVPAMRSSVQPAAGEPALPARYTAGSLVVAGGHAGGGSILAGAPLHGAYSAGSGPHMPEVGVAFVFGADGAGLAVLENPSAAPADWFGYAVATDGSTHVVGAPGHDDSHAGTGDSGIVYVFEGGNTYAVPNPDPAHGDMFGSAVGITDDRITIYCPNCSAEGEADAPYSLDRSDLQASLREHIRAYHGSAAPAAAGSEGAVGAAQGALEPASLLLPWDMAGAPSKAAADPQNAAGFTYVSAGSGAIASASLAEGITAVANGSMIEFSGGAFEWGIAGLDAGASAALAVGLPDMMPEDSAYWALADGMWANASSIAQRTGSSFSLDMLDGGAYDSNSADGQASVTGGFGAAVTNETNPTEMPSDPKRHVSIATTIKISNSTENGPRLDPLDSFGSAVAGIGDLDGDGTPDIAVGAHTNSDSYYYNYNDERSGDERGAVHIMLMNPDGSVRKTIEINSTTPNGPVLSDGDRFGSIVAGIGDLDGDGTPDIAAGKYHVLDIMLMNPDGSVRNTVVINSTTPNGPVLSSFFFLSAAGIGDLDSDGTPDIAVGSTNAVHIMLMNPDGSVRKTTDINSTTPNGPMIAHGDYFGYATAGIGDFNGDGTPDIAAGAFGSDIGGLNTGAVHIMLMKPNGSVNKTIEINKYTPNGPKIYFGEYFGTSLSSMGDLNGDGVNDIAAGTISNEDGAIGRGAVHIMLMNQNGSVASTHTLNALSHNGPHFAYYNGFALSISNIGDLNKDGILDIAVGARYQSHNYANTGVVYVMMLSNEPEPAPPRVKIASTLQGPHAQVDASDGYAYALLHNIDGMSVINASDITDPRIVGIYPHNGTTIRVDGDYAYVGGQETLNMIDVSNKSSLVLAASANTSIGHTKSIDIDGGYAYVGGRDGNVSILRITDHLGLDPVAVFADSAFAGEMYVDAVGDVLYAASRNGLTSIDVSNKSSPKILDHADTYGWKRLHTVTVHGNYAYVGIGGDNKYAVVDISNPSNMNANYVSVKNGHDTFQTAILGNYAYVTSSQGSLMQFDISKHLDGPSLTYTIDKVHPDGIKLESISSDGTHLYAGTSKDLIILEPVNTKPVESLAASGASAKYTSAVQHPMISAGMPLPPFLQQDGPEGASGESSADGALADLTPPTLEYAVFDAESGILSVVFNEAVRSSSTAVDLSRIHIAESDGLNKTALAQAFVIENDHSIKVSIQLTAKQKDALLELAMPHLVVQPEAFADAASNAMNAAASVQISR